jgi:hypothetical protein
MKPIPMPTESDIDRYTDEEYERRRDEDLGLRHWLDPMALLNKIKENSK